MFGNGLAVAVGKTAETISRSAVPPSKEIGKDTSSFSWFVSPPRQLFSYHQEGGNTRVSSRVYASEKNE